MDYVRKVLNENNILPPPPSEEEKNNLELKIIESYMILENKKAVAEHLNCSTSKVSRILTKHNIDSVKHIKKERTPELDELILETYASTNSQKKTAQIVHCCRLYVTEVLEQNNVSTRKVRIPKENREEYDKKILQTYAMCLNKEKTAKEAGCSTTYVTKVLQQNAVT